MDPDESGYDDNSTPSVSVVLLAALLGRILVTSSSLPIVRLRKKFDLKVRVSAFSFTRKLRKLEFEDCEICES